MIIVSDNIKLLTDSIVNSLTEICFYDDFFNFSVNVYNGIIKIYNKLKFLL